MAGTEPSRGPPDLQRRCVAIVGAGPSGFYAAEALLATGAVDVHVYDQLPVPFGLVRHGVAPDHQKLKQVTAVFERIAARPGFTFIGNVQVGHAVGIDDLREAYDAVLLATGCESDAALGIPGETLPGVHAAREFVGWYNGHPDFAEGVYDFSHEHAVIVGHGNVALDVARMLVAPVDYLQSTDITPAALGQLAESRVRHVHLVGRRGPAQARFTDKELRQIGASGFCSVHVDPDDMKLGPASRHEIEAKGAAEVARMVTALRDLAERPGTANSRHLHFHFLRSPIEVQGGSRVERLLLEHNELEGGPGRQRATPTGTVSSLPCGLLLRSVGYRSVPLLDAPFDPGNGRIPSVDGRVHDLQGRVVERLYVAGWAKRGANGVIGTNRACSVHTVNAVLADMAKPGAAGRRPPGRSVDQLLDLQRVRRSSFADWQSLDRLERAAGEALGTPRLKFTARGAMFDAIDTVGTANLAPNGLD